MPPEEVHYEEFVIFHDGWYQVAIEKKW